MAITSQWTTEQAKTQFGGMVAAFAGGVLNLTATGALLMVHATMVDKDKAFGKDKVEKYLEAQMVTVLGYKERAVRAYKADMLGLAKLLVKSFGRPDAAEVHRFWAEVYDGPSFLGGVQRVVAKLAAVGITNQSQLQERLFPAKVVTPEQAAAKETAKAATAKAKEDAIRAEMAAAPATKEMVLIAMLQLSKSDQAWMIAAYQAAMAYVAEDTIIADAPLMIAA